MYSEVVHLLTYLSIYLAFVAFGTSSLTLNTESPSYIIKEYKHIPEWVKESPLIVVLLLPPGGEP